MLNKYAPLIAAVLIVCFSLAFFVSERGSAPPPQAVSGTGDPAHRPPPPPMLPPPLISKLKLPLSCLHAEGDRYDGGVADSFGKFPREGVMLVNQCDTPVNVIDLKVNDTHLAYVYSVQPVRTVVVDTRAGAEKEPDRLVILSRGGDRCDLAGKLAPSCRFLPVTPHHGIFIAVPVENWFSVFLKDSGPVTGFLATPVDPRAPKKPHEVPKMPDKGFKFKPIR